MITTVNAYGAVLNGEAASWLANALINGEEFCEREYNALTAFVAERQRGSLPPYGWK